MNGLASIDLASQDRLIWPKDSRVIPPKPEANRNIKIVLLVSDSYQKD